jgi:hypothetical protein
MSEFSGSDIEELTPERDWTPQNGWTVVKRWRGTPTAIDLKITELQNTFSFGVRMNIAEEDEGGHQVLRAWYGATDSQSIDAPVSDQWSLVGNDLEKSLWVTDEVQNEFAKLTDVSQAHHIKTDIERYLDGETTSFDWSQTPPAEIPLNLSGIIAGIVGIGLSETVFRGLIDALAKGDESRTVSQFVLRRVTTVRNGSSIKPAYNFVNMVLTTDQLIGGTDPGALNIPNTLSFEFPPGFWLKRTPTAEATGSDKFQITQEWWHADQYEPFAYKRV